MRYYVFGTQDQADEAADRIDANARMVLGAEGYTVLEDGGILGKRSGVDDPAAVTMAWDTPRERLDGQWVLLHPENHPSAGSVTLDGRVLDRLTEGLNDLAVEEETPDWWPPADPV